MGAARCSPATQSSGPQRCPAPSTATLPTPGIRLSGKSSASPASSRRMRARVCATPVASPPRKAPRWKGADWSRRTAPRWPRRADPAAAPAPGAGPRWRPPPGARAKGGRPPSATRARGRTRTRAGPTPHPSHTGACVHSSTARAVSVTSVSRAPSAESERSRGVRKTRPRPAARAARAPGRSPPGRSAGRRRAPARRDSSGGTVRKWQRRGSTTVI